MLLSTETHIALRMTELLLLLVLRQLTPPIATLPSGAPTLLPTIASKPTHYNSIRQSIKKTVKTNSNILSNNTMKMICTQTPQTSSWRVGGELANGLGDSGDCEGASTEFEVLGRRGKKSEEPLVDIEIRCRVVWNCGGTG